MKTLKEIILESLEEELMEVNMSHEEKLQALGKYALELGGLINKGKIKPEEVTKLIFRL